jgi:quercetin dioxygenase-like cupin family protein
LGAKEDEVEMDVTHVPPGEGRSLWVLGELVTYKTTSEQTGGAYSLFEVTTQPGGGVLPHVQHREDESFYILHGEYEFLDDGGGPTRVDVESLVYVLRDNLHAHRNVGTTTGRMLISQTPGGSHERFFEEIGEPAMDGSRPSASEGPQDMRRTIAIYLTARPDYYPFAGYWVLVGLSRPRHRLFLAIVSLPVGLPTGRSGISMPYLTAA